MPKWLSALVGAVEIAGGAAMMAFGVPLGANVLMMGIGTEVSGIGSLLSKGPIKGFSTTLKDPIGPWEIIYGRQAVGGNMIFCQEFGDNDKYMDMVFCLADHPSAGVVELMFNRALLQIDTTRVPSGVAASTYPIINGGTSFGPAQQTNLDIYNVKRINGVVTVYLEHSYGSGADIPLLSDGDMVKVHDISAHGHTPASAYTSMNGIYQVFDVVHDSAHNRCRFSYLCGGLSIVFGTVIDDWTVTTPFQSGQVDTQWQNFGTNVYMEVLTGTQTLGQTFVGCQTALPDGSYNSSNPWTNYCSGVGKTLVFLRFHYDAPFTTGIPQLSFLLWGKNGIYDPRLSSQAGPTGVSQVLIVTQGTGYVVGDVLTLAGGTGAQITVTAVNAGAITGYTLTAPGTGYSPTAAAAVTGGTGTGAVFNINGLGGFTENFALCWNDYMCNSQYGFSCTLGVDIDQAGLIADANICDQPVALAAGGFEARYACDGKFQTSMTRGQVLEDMLAGMGGRLTFINGQFRCNPAAWNGTVTAAPDLGAMVAPLVWKSTPNPRDLFNCVKGTYITQVNNWQSGDFPPYCQDSTHGYTLGTAWTSGHTFALGDYTVYQGIGYVSLQASNTNHEPDTSGSWWAVSYQDVNLVADGGQRRAKDIQLRFTISPSCAQRLAKIELARLRGTGNAGAIQYGEGTLSYNLSAYQFTALDVISVTFAALSWSGRVFEVGATRLRFVEGEDGAIALVTELDVHSTDQSIYDWSTQDELSAAGYEQSQLPSTQNPDPPSSLALESDLTTAQPQSNGILASQILVTWTDPADGYFVEGGHIECQYELSTGGTWQSVASVLPGVQQLYIPGVLQGKQYNVQIRAVNTAGIPSAWVSAGPVTVSSLSASPYGPNGGLTFPPFGDPLDKFGTFYLTSGASTRMDGSVLAQAQVFPVVPINAFSALAVTPVLSPTYTQASTGGYIPGGVSLWVALAAIDSAGAYTALSDAIEVNIAAGTNTNTLTLTANNYAAAMVSLVAFIGYNEQILNGVQILSGASSVTVTNIATNGAISVGMPDARFANFVLGITKVLLAGSLGGVTGSLLTATGYTTLSSTSIKAAISGATLTPSALIGRALRWVAPGNALSVASLQACAITANDASTITFSVSAPPSWWAGGSVSLHANDLVSVALQPTLSGGGLVVTDSLLAMTANQYQNCVLRVFFADGSNQTSFIVSNTATAFTVQSPFTAAGPLWFWVEAGSFSSMTPVNPAQVAAYATGWISNPLTAPIDNIPGFFAVQVFSSDPYGNLSPAGYSPIRSFYWAGVNGTTPNPGQQIITPDGSNNLNIDLAAGQQVEVILTSAMESGTPAQTLCTFTAPVWTGKTIAAGIPDWTLLIVMDSATTGHAVPNFVTGAGGFAADGRLAQNQIDSTPNTMTAIRFGFRGGLWCINSFSTGGAIS